MSDYIWVNDKAEIEMEDGTILEVYSKTGAESEKLLHDGVSIKTEQFVHHRFTHLTEKIKLTQATDYIKELILNNINQRILTAVTIRSMINATQEQNYPPVCIFWRKIPTFDYSHDFSDTSGDLICRVRFSIFPLSDLVDGNKLQS